MTFTLVLECDIIKIHKQKLREPLYSMAGVAVIEIYSTISIFIVNNA